MPTSKKPIVTEAPCPKCGTIVTQADRRASLVSALDKSVWQCPACHHPFNYPPRVRQRKRA